MITKLDLSGKALHLGPLLAAGLLVCVPRLQAQTVVSPTSAALEARLDGPGTVPLPIPSGFADELRRFYQGREFAPVWSSEGGRDRLAELLDALARAPEDGLRSEDYLGVRTTWLLESESESTPAARAELELGLSAAFMAFAAELARGRVDPRRLPGEWSNERESFDAVATLSAAVTSGPARTLDGLRPIHGQYGALRSALESMRRMPEWGRVPDGETLEIGDADRRVAAVRDRLLRSGDLTPQELAENAAGLFDAVLEEGVKRFQRRHGLHVDGIVGAATIEALNVTVADRVRQIEANLERWRWLPRDLGARRVIVNIPGFSVTLETSSGVIGRHRAIVGRTDRETPAFSSAIESFALAPYWNVPPTLARADVLPQIRADIEYLGGQSISVLENGSETPVDPETIDWASVSDDEFLERYRLRQEPGPLNALGDVKLVFLNPFTVSLHDTPSRALFERSSRALSSGCIRVERPLEVLDWLLAGDPEWPVARISDVIQAGDEQHGRIRAPVPIHLLYLTAVVEEDGRPGFRPDLYELDDALLQALRGVPGTAGVGVTAGPLMGSCA